MVVENDFEDSGNSKPSPLQDYMGTLSLSRNSPLKSIFVETGGSGGNVEASYVDTTPNRGDPL